jgi:hypothetical protein
LKKRLLNDMFFVASTLGKGEGGIKMGMFDTIIGELECPRCGKTKEREIQIHGGPCLQDTYYTGDIHYD